jgi:Ca2+-binding RTX toxin-like protein
MVTIVGKKKYGTAIGDTWDLGDYYDRSEFWTYGGHDFLTIHCDRSYINTGDGNDSLTLTGAWNFVRMGDGIDIFYYYSPYNLPSQIGNTISLGSGNDNATIIGNLNILNGDSGYDEASVTGNDNKVNLGDDSDLAFLSGARNSISMGLGNDFFGYDYAPSEIIESSVSLGAGNDTAHISGERNTIIGEAGNDNISIIGHNNIVAAGTGNDFVWSRGLRSKIDLGDGNDDLIIFGNNATITGGAGSDHVSIFGNFNEYISGTNDIDEGLIVNGVSNRINCDRGGFGYIICSGDRNRIRTNTSNIDLSYSVKHRRGANNQTTTINGVGNTINWAVAAKGSDQQSQRLHFSWPGPDFRTGDNRVFMKVDEGAVASIIVDVGVHAVYLNALVDANKSNQIDGRFWINVEIASRHAEVIFHNNLFRNVGITMNQRADNGWIYDFADINGNIYGGLQVSRADGLWRFSQ